MHKKVQRDSLNSVRRELFSICKRAQACSESCPFQVLEPYSPLLDDEQANGNSTTPLLCVNSETGLCGAADAVVDGARVIVRSASGRPIVVRGFREGRPLVGLNLPAMVSDEPGLWPRGGGNLVRNAIFYATCKPTNSTGAKSTGTARANATAPPAHSRSRCECRAESCLGEGGGVRVWLAYI